MSDLTLVTGGARSGKSDRAVQLVRDAENRAFVATAEASDGDMTERIRRHRQRRGDDFSTIEEPVDLAGAIDRIPGDCDAAVVDCLTVWLGNLMHHEPPLSVDHHRLHNFYDQLEELHCDLVVVTNEVGMGVLPGEERTRTYRDVAGRVNQRVADRADRVILMVSGIPVPISELSASAKSLDDAS